MRKLIKIKGVVNNQISLRFSKGAIIQLSEIDALRSPKAPNRRAVICAINEPNGYTCIFTRRMPQQPTECRLPQSWSAPNQTRTLRFPCAGCRQPPFERKNFYKQYLLRSLPIKYYFKRSKLKNKLVDASTNL